MMSTDEISNTSSSLFSERILATLKSPGGDDSDQIELAENGLRSRISGEVFPFVDGVPSLFAVDGKSEDIRKRVQDFYEENPFPSYDGLEEFGELVNKGRHNPFTSELLKAIGYNKLVLECGCGTGQLSHFLQLNNNHVLGIDMTLNSLELALEHKRRNQLSRSAFAQMNIFDLAIKDDTFDVVISHGVLHHTADARRAFSCITRKVKPGGIVIVGLYNSYARIMTWMRSKLVGIFGDRIDYVVRNRIQDERKAQIWIQDQYFNPHETWHSIGEVLRWFEEDGIEFLNCYPRILDSSGEDDTDFFGASDAGTPYQRAITQISWLGTIAREGSLFDMIGRRKA
jgi:2-polyprenyl-3-methyl-5-hydroxy-6-metoxy-1,4-benzoquinol methylase